MALAVFAVGSSFFGGEDDASTSVLQPYSEGFVAAAESTDDDDDGRAALAADRAAPAGGRGSPSTSPSSQGFLDQGRGALERANLPLRPAEALFFYVAGVVVRRACSAARHRRQPARRP